MAEAEHPTGLEYFVKKIISMGMETNLIRSLNQKAAYQMIIHRFLDTEQQEQWAAGNKIWSLVPLSFPLKYRQLNF